MEFLNKELVRLTEKTAYELRQEGKITGCITVKIRYEDFTTVSKQEVIDYTALDNMLLAKVKDLFTKLYKKGQKVRLLGVKFSHLIPMTLQMNMFNNENEKLDLFKTIDDIKNQFGSGVIQKATSLPVSNKKRNSKS